jgi:hypothetical protein
MNWKTTLALVLLAGGCGLLFWKGPQVLSRKSGPAGESESTRLVQEFSTQNLVAVEVLSGEKSLVKLQAPAFGKPLELVGNWPVRQAELDELVQLLTNLRSRFAPIPLAADADLSGYGLDAKKQNPITVKVKINDKGHTLLFGQPASNAGENSFTQPTYLRIDEQPDLLRLGPDVLNVLRRGEEEYRLRRIFPEKSRLRVSEEIAPNLASDERPTTKMTELLDDRVTRIHIDGPAGSYTLEKIADLPKEKPLPSRPQGDTFVTPVQLAESWRLTYPVGDRVDPVKLRTILSLLSDLWVEKFLDLEEAKRLGWPLISNPSMLTDDQQKAAGITFSGAGSLLKGDKAPQISLTFRDGTTRILKIGKVTRSDRRVEPPPQLPGVPPLPPKEILDDYRLAQLGTNPLPFEIKADKLNQLFINLEATLSASGNIENELRDLKLLHFSTGEVSRVEISKPDRLPMLLERTEKGNNSEGRKEYRWDLKQPVQGLAETAPIEELLSAFTAVSVNRDDVVDPAKAKDKVALGLDPLSATKVTLTLLGKPRTLLLGKREGGKIYAQVEGWDRVNRIEDRLYNLTDRSARVYRALKLFDLGGNGSEAGNRVSSIRVEKGSEKFLLQEVPGLGANWTLAEPVQTSVDSGKVSNLAKDLGGLQVTEFVHDPLSGNEMLRASSIFSGAIYGQEEIKTSEFGLEAPTLKVQITFAGPKKMEEQTLLLGSTRSTKQDVYARFANSPGVFAIAKSALDPLNGGSLGMLPLQLTSANFDALSSIEITRGSEPAFTLKSEAGKWSLSNPIQANVDPSLILNLANSLSSLRAERYEAHKSDDPAKFGLIAPAVKIRFSLPDSRKPSEGAKERVLLIGNPEAADKPNRFAKFDNEPAIFVLNENLFRSADLSMYDLIDRKLLNLNTSFATRVEIDSPEGSLKLTREQNPWKVEGANFNIDQPTLDQLLTRFKDLTAEKFAAFGNQIDFPKYGLDPASKPTKITLALGTETHTVEIGKPVDEKAPTGSRFARIDNGPSVVILNPAVAEDLLKSRLEFVDRTLIRFDPIELQGITRTMGGQTLELKQGVTGGWEITKPLGKPADTETLEDLANRCAKLRADKVVALDSKDLAKFGLDTPQVVITFELLDQRSGKEVKRTLKIGKPVDEKKPEGDRYLQVEGSSSVGILGAPIAKRLLGEPVRFLNRSLASFISADRIEITQGDRKVTFQKDAGWKLKSPVDADAEDESLREVHDMLARLKADDIVVEKPASLAEYGLDKPEFTWKLFSGEKELLSLLIGKREKDDFRRYAKLEKGDLVVLLDRGISSRLESEYRKRSLGEKIDPLQVTELSLSGPQGKLTLKKLGTEWKDLLKLDDNWNNRAVQELVEALSQAEVYQFVKDKDAALADFGLDAAQARTISLRTGMGASRTLLLGKLDPSKRLYAKFQDATRTEVFVLSERDSIRLNRNRGDLLSSDRELLPPPKEKQ